MQHLVASNRLGSQALGATRSLPILECCEIISILANLTQATYVGNPTIVTINIGILSKPAILTPAALELEFDRRTARKQEVLVDIDTKPAHGILIAVIALHERVLGNHTVTREGEQ